MLDGSESQYSGMQIGTLQDEEEEGVAPAADEAAESFAHSVLGTNQTCTIRQYAQKPRIMLTSMLF